MEEGILKNKILSSVLVLISLAIIVITVMNEFWGDINPDLLFGFTIIIYTYSSLSIIFSITKTVRKRIILSCILVITIFAVCLSPFLGLLKIYIDFQKVITVMADISSLFAILLLFYNAIESTNSNHKIQRELDKKYDISIESDNRWISPVHSITELVNRHNGFVDNRIIDDLFHSYPGDLRLINYVLYGIEYKNDPVINGYRSINNRWVFLDDYIMNDRKLSEDLLLQESIKTSRSVKKKTVKRIAKQKHNIRLSNEEYYCVRSGDKLVMKVFSHYYCNFKRPDGLELRNGKNEYYIGEYIYIQDWHSGKIVNRYFDEQLEELYLIK